MNECKVPRIMFTAAKSGGGKTTVTCAVLQALKNRNLAVTSFKCGPDYIDPMFHRNVIGMPSRNLDLFMLSEDTVIDLLCRNTKDSDIAVMEGVMGFYDGAGSAGMKASSYDLSKLTSTPSVLIVDCKGAAVSSVALIKGFFEYTGDNTLKGVILNNISERYYHELKKLIETELGIRVYGYLPHMKDCELKSRHLGLITADEIEDLKTVLKKLGEQAEKSIDIDELLSLSKKSEPLKYTFEDVLCEEKRLRIGVANDKAFCFYYQDGLDLLERLGAEIINFSPLDDDCLPDDLDGVIIGGGYPELYAGELAENVTFKDSLKKHIEDGMPCFAECGGFMYLHDSIESQEGIKYEMCGIFNAHSFKTEKLQRFGYIELIANVDNILSKCGEIIKAHEFHYWDSTQRQDVYSAEKSDGRHWGAFSAYKNTLAGYPHIHLYSNRSFAESFIRVCDLYSAKRRR